MYEVVVCTPQQVRDKGSTMAVCLEGVVATPPNGSRRNMQSDGRGKFFDVVDSLEVDHSCRSREIQSIIVLLCNHLYLFVALPGTARLSSSRMLCFQVAPNENPDPRAVEPQRLGGALLSIVSSVVFWCR